ncbi:MAG TPA: hypothetical protein VNW95_06825 [Mucilaginibacter sp.]|jgi:hypothetical protein|nr:hypothetical protein [Mucilaginibacter sp.]
MKQIAFLLFVLLVGAYDKSNAQEKPYSRILHHLDDSFDIKSTYIKAEPGQTIVINHITWTPAGNGHDGDQSVLEEIRGPFGNAVLESDGPIGLEQFFNARKKGTYRDLPILFVFPLKDNDNDVNIVVKPGEVLQLVPNGNKYPYQAYITGKEYK